MSGEVGRAEFFQAIKKEIGRATAEVGKSGGRDQVHRGRERQGAFEMIIPGSSALPALPCHAPVDLHAKGGVGPLERSQGGSYLQRSGAEERHRRSHPASTLIVCNTLALASGNPSSAFDTDDRSSTHPMISFSPTLSKTIFSGSFCAIGAS